MSMLDVLFNCALIVIAVLLLLFGFYFTKPNWLLSAGCFIITTLLFVLAVFSVWVVVISYEDKLALAAVGKQIAKAAPSKAELVANTLALMFSAFCW